MLKGRNKEEKVKAWYHYFKELLGEYRKITDEKKTVTTILDDSDLNIKTFHFTNSDGISREVLKQCEINDIIINFASNILIKNEKPAQLGESDMIPIP